MLRAYVENAALLKPHGFSYRSYLQSIVPSAVPPRGDVLQPEARWVAIIDRDFHNVGRPLANYLVCDWLLWFSIRGEIDCFASFKADSVHERSVAAMLDLSNGPGVRRILPNTSRAGWLRRSLWEASATACAERVHLARRQPIDDGQTLRVVSELVSAFMMPRMTANGPVCRESLPYPK
jgi:hypothetical protein